MMLVPSINRDSGSPVVCNLVIFSFFSQAIFIVLRFEEKQFYHIREAILEMGTCRQHII